MFFATPKCRFPNSDEANDELVHRILNDIFREKAACLVKEDTITSKYGAFMRSNTTFYVRDDTLGGMCARGCVIRALAVFWGGARYAS